MKLPFLTAKTKASFDPPKEVDELVVGKVLSLELFKEYLKDLGYDFELFTDKENKIYRFQRYNKDNSNPNGDIW
jgi:aspartokinase